MSAANRWEFDIEEEEQETRDQQRKGRGDRALATAARSKDAALGAANAICQCQTCIAESNSKSAAFNDGEFRVFIGESIDFKICQCQTFIAESNSKHFKNLEHQFST